ncbi:hypothetical protein [Zhouia amylolytica]|uniref:hypothetical protein n=1 Tax=Zhouia amylolytica TaxID=376730 RepID=UPI0020CE5FA2|nr:hypothetical protein [Zhouia amylolytica]MCQ0113029.1 hypothetical protein [Zhouia amylolytica]
MPRNCSTCIHKRKETVKGIFCSYWVEYVSKIHACIMHENENDPFINLHNTTKFRKMERDDYLNVLKLENPEKFKQEFEQIERFRNTSVNTIGQPLTQIF